LILAEEIFNSVRKEQEVNPGFIFDFAKTLVDTMFVESSEHFFAFYDKKPLENYLYTHSLNVSFLSIKIGMWLGLNKSEIMELAVASFLHDLGMVKVEGIVKKEGRLGITERRLVGRHAEYSEQVLRKIGCVNETGLISVRAHHDRDPAKHRISQIISLADIYEAITHSRAYKKARTPHQAVGEIIEKETVNFHPDIIRAFVNNIGIYPVGSWVRLSTGEVGVVVEANKGYPLRPRVNVVFDHLGERAKDTKKLNFMTESYFYIEGPFDISDVAEAELKLREGKNAN
ncbi:MAG: HD domain-containing protein, partial [Candidatus Omnitrophica bacterium]|nr:HD domain-containing protein [Candidatus Omnitrophota bacterium]